MDSKKPLRRGIVVDPAAKGTVIHGSRIRGMDVGIHDAGDGTTIKSTVIEDSASSNPADQGESSGQPWQKTTLGDVAVKVFTGLLIIAASWAVVHYWTVFFP